MTTTKTAIEFIREARKVATPLLAIQTLDPQGVITASINSLKEGTPIITLDCARGFTAVTQPGAAAIGTIAPDHNEQPATDIGFALGLLLKLPASACCFLLNGHRFLQSVDVIQGIANLRDKFKANRRTLILLGPDMPLPAEVAQDIALFDDPLPTDDDYAAIATRMIANANQNRKAGRDPVPNPSAAEMGNIVAALRGLAPFPAEQALALSLRPSGYDHEELWRRKKYTVEANQGMRFEYATGVRMEDVIGLDALAQWAQRIKNGPCPPKVIFFMDEIEKMTAGAAGDSSGVSQAQLGSFLTWSSERKAKGVPVKGILILGSPGVGKSYLAEAMANSLNIPFVKANFGDMKGSLVGETERMTRMALKVVDGIGGADVLMIATCNQLDKLPPELRDRFSVGTWYVDLPSEEAQNQMFDWYTARDRYTGYDFGELPVERHFSGRDIMNIVESAWMQQVSIREAALTSNVPVSVSQPKMVAALREMAHGVFLSAHQPGPYYMPDSDEARRLSLGGRMVSLADEE